MVMGMHFQSRNFAHGHARRRPEIVPTVGVTFFVPVYATTLQVTDVAETWPEALAANVMFSLDKNAMLAL